MSTDPGDAAVREQLGQQAQDVTGTPSAGIFGDPAGAAQPSAQQMDLSAATPAAVNPDDLQAQLARQQEQINALLAAREAERAEVPADADPVDVTPHVGTGSPELRQALTWLHKRVSAIEEHLSLSAIEAVLRDL